MEFDGRDLHLVRKALAMAILTIERQDGPFQSVSDMGDMEGLLERITGDPGVLAHYTRAARIACNGTPE